MTAIVDLSLSGGVFPSCFQSAYVSPLLKKSILDKENMKNYRKTFNENQPDYLNAMLTPSVPSRSLRSNNGINFSVSKVKSRLVQGLFVLVAPLCGIGFLSLSGQLLQQNLSRDV